MKKGFSFIVLTASVVVILLLVTTVTIAGTTTANNSRKLSFAMELNALTQSVNSYANSNNGEYPVGNNIVVNISNIDSEYVSQFSDEEIVGNTVALAEIDYEKIGYTTLKYGNGKDGENDVYAVSPLTGKVYYAKGLKIGTKVYYTLTSELENTLSYNTQSSNAKNDTSLIVFSLSDTNWTKNTISLSIKVPNEYELVNILVNNTPYTNYETTTEGKNKVYKISRNGNFIVNVVCRKDGTSASQIEAKCNITNYDNTPPTLTVDTNLVELNAQESEDLLGFLRISEKGDTQSGIKYIKYETNSIFNGTLTDEQKGIISAHFENNGIPIYSDIIPIEKGTRQVTVYIEDNAGNWKVQSINL